MSKKIIIPIVSLVLISAIVYTVLYFFFAPSLAASGDGFIMNTDEWLNYVSETPEAYENTTDENFADFDLDSTLNEGDVIFAGNSVLEISDGFYIIGVNGVSGKYVNVMTFSRSGDEDTFLYSDALDESEVYKKRIEIVSSDSSDFPIKSNGINSGFATFGGYANRFHLAAPETIENDEIVFRVTSGENYSEEEFFTYNVKTKIFTA